MAAAMSFLSLGLKWLTHRKGPIMPSVLVEPDCVDCMRTDTIISVDESKVSSPQAVGPSQLSSSQHFLSKLLPGKFWSDKQKSSETFTGVGTKLETLCLYAEPEMLCK